MKVSISLSDLVVFAAEKLASDLRVSQSELFASAMREYLDKYVGASVTERLSAVYAIENAAIDTGLADAQHEAIRHERAASLP